MKRLFGCIVLCCLAVDSMISQEIDPLLSSAIKENRTHIRNVRKGQAKPDKSITVKIMDSDGNEIIPDETHVVNGVDTMMMKERMNLRYNAEGEINWISVIGRLKEGTECPIAALEAIGVKVTCQVGTVVCLSVPATAWDTLKTMSEFERLEADRMNHLDNDNTRTITGVAYVTGEKSGAALPEKKYNGEGVIVGVIDTGIDFNHAMFRDAEGHTRIKEALIFSDEYDASPNIYTTEEEIKGLTTGTTTESHGSHTSATAAGSYVEGLDCRGMAPKADLILCDLQVLYNSHVIKAAQEIFRYADSVKKPAVINLSLGGHNFPYNAAGDAQTAFATFTENGTTPGHIICISAGNEADEQIGMSKKVSGGHLKTVAVAKSSVTANGQTCGEYAATNLAIYNIGGHPFSVALKAVNKNDGTTRELDEKSLVCQVSGSKAYVYPISQTTYTSTEESIDGLTYNHVIIDLPDDIFILDSLYMIGLDVTATDGDEIRIVNQYGDSYLYFCGQDKYPGLVGYESGDGEMSINNMVCTDAVISVGAWFGKATWRCIDGDYYQSWPGNTGEIALFSSYGKDDHGIARPDILAPGVNLNSALNLYDATYFTNQALNTSSGDYPSITQAKEITWDGTTRLHATGIMSGTSMACPTATGIVALWLQADPTLTVSRIREMLTENALNDKYTTNVKNVPSGNLIQAGKGKIDALRGIKQILGTEKYPIDVAVTLSDARLATFSSEYPLNLASSSAPKAYSASNYDGTTVTFQRQEGKLQANTGMLLSAEAGTYKIPIAPEGTSCGTNLLYGTATGSVTLNTASEAYVLAKPNTGAIGFYPNAAGLTVGQGKAYLKLPEGEPAVKGMALVFNEETDDEREVVANVTYIEPNDDSYYVIDGATDISPALRTPDSKFPTSVMYNLAGQRLSHMQKGINIINGKKHIIL